MRLASVWRKDRRVGAMIEAGLQRRRCAWCERELRPCNMARHVAARHHRQLTIDDVIAAAEEEAA